jgi:voltage-gated potassium channel
MPDTTAHRDARQRAAQGWERLSTWPFLMLSAVFIVVYSIHCLDTHLLPGLDVALLAILGVIWLVFVVDYVVRLLLAVDKRAFVRQNLADLLAALVPVFRPFRLLRELRRIEYFHGRTGSAVRARVIAYSAAFVALWVYTMSVTVVAVERGAPGARIVSLGDALYWSTVTITTVGYGDLVPVTTLGRVLAVMLMISGVGIVGITTATVVSFFGDAVRTHTVTPASERDDERPHDKVQAPHAGTTADRTGTQQSPEP